MFPSTPLEFARHYAKLVSEMNAEGANKIVSDCLTMIAFDGAPQVTQTREEQLASLTEFYKILEQSGKTLRATDFSITQLSNDFALIKYTWTVSGADQVADRINSTYVIRRETEGWRTVILLELGPSAGPA